jgi:hypothetical protein
MRRRLSYGTLVVLPLVLGGCAATFDATRVGVPVTLASSSTAPTAGTPFKVTSHPTYALFGLAAFTRPQLDKALTQQLIGAKAITNVRVTMKSRWIDVLVTGLTFGLIVPRTMVVEGTVVADSATAVPTP